MHELLVVENVCKSYPSASGRLDVLQGVSLAVNSGELIAITGESGSGKSTLLHILGTLDRPDSGRVLVEGKDVFDSNDAGLATFRNRRIGFVFQFHHLLPEFTALENVAMPALIGGQTLDASRGRASELLESLGLSARVDHRPGQLSGGEQQRVAVARALMNNPDLVLADEPTGNLDVKTAEHLHDQIARLSRELNQTFVIVTHNPALAAHADRVLELVEGRLVATHAV
jgi:lipoprotein-releasing system ATP-binding protein